MDACMHTYIHMDKPFSSTNNLGLTPSQAQARASLRRTRLSTDT